MVISSNIIWISSDKNNEINKYLKQLENLPFYKINIFNSIEESINKIKTIRFEETFIIINGNLFIQFIETFQKNLKNFYIIPKIIIFTDNKEEFINKNIKHRKLINNLFYNSGGIKTNIKEINKYIINSMYKKKELLHREDSKQLSFENIDCKEKLLLPLFYKTLIELSQNDNIEQFTKSLCNKYGNKSKELDMILNSLNTVSDIPIEILSKYYTRVYTDKDSHFYNDINKDLREKNQNNYLSYIKVLYKGIKLQSLPISNDKMLYHGSILLNKDIEKIKKYLNNTIDNLPGAIIFSKAFLSFNKDKNIEKYLLNINENKKDYSKVLFILEKDENIDYSLSTHTDIEEFSNEKEVLFFPFSTFEISSINEINDNNEKICEIKLSYLGKYIKEFIKDKKLNEKIIPDTEFKQEIIKYGLIKPDILNKNNNNKELIKRYEEYKDYINNNKNDNNNIEKIVKKKDEKEKINHENIIQITVNKANYISNNKKKDNKNNDNKKHLISKNELNNSNSNSNINRSKDRKKKNLKHLINIFDSNNSKNDIKKKSKEKFDVRNNKKNITETNKQSKTKIVDNSEKKNYIIGEINIEEKDLNKEIRIINSFEESKISEYIKNEELNMYENEKDIKDNCLIKINEEKIDFSYFYNFKKKGKYKIEFTFKSKLKKINCLFYECSLLTSLNLSNFNTENVTNMAYMFYKCNSLVSLNLTNFNTQDVTNMAYMFVDCYSLKSLNVSNFNTQKVENIGYMFNGCYSLTSLNLSNFNTKNVTNMENMFSQCYELNSLNLSNFNTQNVTNMAGMFSSCEVLKSLNLSSFNTPKLENIEGMFRECKSLTSLNLSNFNTQNITNMEDLFVECNSLKSINLSNFNTQNVTNMRGMFYGCNKLASLNISNLNTQNVTNMRGIFHGCNSLTLLNLSNFNTENVTNMKDMFGECNSLTSLNLSNFNTENVSNMAGMFFGCNKLTSLNLSNFNTQNVTDMEVMFGECYSLELLDLSNFNTQNDANLDDMFVECKSLTKKHLLCKDLNIINQLK